MTKCYELIKLLLYEIVTRYEFLLHCPAALDNLHIVDSQGLSKYLDLMLSSNTRYDEINFV